MREERSLVQKENRQADAGKTQSCIFDPHGKEGFPQLSQESTLLCECIARPPSGRPLH